MPVRRELLGSLGLGCFIFCAEQLRPAQLGIGTAAGQQVAVLTGLDNPAFIHDANQIGILYGRQAMRDDEGPANRTGNSR